MKELAEILKPIKDAIVVMESDKCTLADCYYELIKLAASIKSIPIEYHRNFRNYCIKKFNNRWNEFDFDEYLIEYFLHPGYRGIIISLLFIKYSYNLLLH